MVRPFRFRCLAFIRRYLRLTAVYQARPRNEIDATEELMARALLVIILVVTLITRVVNSAHRRCRYEKKIIIRRPTNDSKVGPSHTDCP